MRVHTYMYSMCKCTYVCTMCMCVHVYMHVCAGVHVYTGVSQQFWGHQHPQGCPCLALSEGIDITAG